MALCATCQTIDLPNLPTLTGFKFDFKNTFSVGKPHHEFQNLRESALSCLSCSLMFKRFMNAATAERPRGTIGYGPDGNRVLHRVPQDTDPVLLVGLSRSGWTETEKRLYGFQALCGSLIINYGLFTDEGTTAALSKSIVGRIPRPIEQCDKPLEWLRTCLNTHAKCTLYEKIVRNELSFPTRVLDVGLTVDSDVLRLVYGAGLVGRYIALSHCWGKNPVIRTLKASLDSYLEAIDPDLLTNTFRDAVMLARRLGVQYLWIDSLCIVQDDSEDWEREAACMAQVYSQSLVTLAASAASDGTQGFFRVEPEYPSIEISFSSRTSSEVHNVVVGEPVNRFQNLTKEPLNTRAWTLQERVLSPRTLHYARDQLHWECREIIESEAGSPLYYPRFNQSEDISYYDGWLDKIASDLTPAPQSHSKTAIPEVENEDGLGDQDSWYGLVEAYTQRDISFGGDKLPALSGLASAYGSRHEGAYVAGLWSQDLVFGLLWYARNNEPLQRPAEYRAPSWSWASVDGPVNFFTLNCGRIPEWLIEIENLVYWTSPAGLDPFGKVSDGGLTLTGYLKQAEIKTVQMEVLEDIEIDGKLLGEGDAPQMLFDEVSAIGTITLDSILPDKQVFCLLITSSYLQGFEEVESAVILLLVPTRKENEYSRVGFAGLHKTRDFKPEMTLRPETKSWRNRGEDEGEQETLAGWFDDAEKLEITIV